MSLFTQNFLASDLFLRNQFPSEGFFDIPIIAKQPIPDIEYEAIGYHNAKASDKKASTRLVHGFKDDYRINSAYNQPEKSFKRISGYAVLCSPNYSFVSNQSTSLQAAAVFRSRWVGAYWQSRGKLVVPNVGWGLPDSYEFCFLGIEKGSTVIVSTMGTGSTRYGFLKGYDEMLRRIEPEAIWCYCNPYPEMLDTVTRVIPYEATGLKKTLMVCKGQLSIFDCIESGWN